MAESSRITILVLLSLIVIVTVLLWLNAVLVPYVKVFFYPCNSTRDSSAQQVYRVSGNQEQQEVYEAEIVETVYIVNDIKLEENKQNRINQRPKNNAQCTNIRNEDRFDCDPEGAITQSNCEKRECCWRPVLRLTVNQSAGIVPPLNVPWCYYPSNYEGYKVNKVYNTKLGLNADLTRTTPSPYPEAIKDLTVEIRYETQSRLRIKIYDPATVRYEVPLNTPDVSQAVNDTLYTVSISKPTETFSVSVIRKDNSVALINTTGASPLTFCNQFIELSSFLPSSFIYGLGEHRGPLLHNVNWTRYTMWNKDNPPHEKANLYGSHPFYLVMENDGKSHGVFLLNSNAMDVILQPAPAITWRTIGGIIDLYVFMGPTPGEVIQQYTEVIGHSFMPPYWSLGFHLCRWGYKTANETLAVVEKNRQAAIPQDVQWNDIDYMDSKKDFTYSTEFGDMPAMVNTLHSKGMHYIMIMDPGISNKSPGNYGPYDLGIKLDIFIKDSQGKPLIGKVWPGDVVFPDFTNNRSFDYWTQLVKSFHDKVQFDGMWIDMNEISNFVAGSINSCPKNSIEDPPYVPDVAGGSLRFSTICATSQQNLSISYNVHNLYGLTETQATYTALKTVRNKRPFIISRSTYAGQGYYGGHWSGDNFATYHDMAMSIPELLNFNMFGISMIGADICGFQLDTTEELCQRWYQLGAFYPFSRSHNSVGLKPQDPASFSQDLIDSTKTAYMIRYSLLPYLYTLFHKSHMMGETVARPLFFEFPQDKNTYSIDSQFLWGSSLMISPALQKGTTSIGAYFPSGVWYDWYTGGAIRSNGSVVKLAAPANKINLHVRGGSILTLQDPDLTTTLSRKNKFSLVVSLDVNGTAEGDLFWDDGDTIDTHTMGKFNMIRFLTSKNTVTNNVMYAGYTDEPMILRSIVVYGVLHKPSTVKFNGKAVSQFTYDNLHVLRAQGIAANMLKTFTFQWV
ncbi:lysosomal alpha-glucosidase-like [Mytilus galloprovincialis]|uniref:lysosomal alpha-glucosidase-like n=1 Tax=Mytilus galloprovincialis TaxID=29158 RepID=UPI003F7BDDFE